MDYTRWLDEKPPCVACRKIHGRKGESTPCEACEVILLDENVDIMKVYLACRNQVIAISTAYYYKAIDLNVIAIKTVMDIYGIDPQLQGVYFDKIRHLFLEIQREKGD